MRNVQMWREFRRKNDEKAEHTWVCEHFEEVFRRNSPADGRLLLMRERLH